MLDILKDKKLILASGSARRREILKEANLPFTLAEGYEVDESYPSHLPSDEVAGYICNKKSFGYPKVLGENDILLTADTIVVVENTILGKPCDRVDASKMLNLLSGRSHKVISGYTLRTLKGTTTKSITTKVWFNKLSQQQIDYYIDNYKPFDKAGSYGLQEWIGLVGVEKIEGSYYNVVGLPIDSVIKSLEEII